MRRNRKADLFCRILTVLFLHVFVLIPAFSGVPARADEPRFSPSAMEGTAGEKVQLFAGQGFDAAQPMLFGVRMEMPEGWHTYWRNPGDSGIAPSFDWSESENVKFIEVLWPVPQRFDAVGDTTFGYAREVVWPVLVQVDDPTKHVTVTLKMNYGVCSDICVPGTYKQGLTMATGSALFPEIYFANRDIIQPFLARVPRALHDNEVLDIKANSKALQVTLRGVTGGPQLIVEGPRGIRFAKPEQRRDGDLLLYQVPYRLTKGAGLKGQEVTLIFTGPDTALEAIRKVQ